MISRDRAQSVVSMDMDVGTVLGEAGSRVEYGLLSSPLVLSYSQTTVI